MRNHGDLTNNTSTASVQCCKPTKKKNLRCNLKPHWDNKKVLSKRDKCNEHTIEIRKRKETHLQLCQYNSRIY